MMGGGGIGLCEFCEEFGVSFWWDVDVGIMDLDV